MRSRDDRLGSKDQKDLPPFRADQGNQAYGTSLSCQKSSAAAATKAHRIRNKRSTESNRLENSGVNVSDNISVNIKYDSFQELEHSKFKINNLANRGGIRNNIHDNNRK